MDCTHRDNTIFDFSTQQFSFHYLYLKLKGIHHFLVEISQCTHSSALTIMTNKVFDVLILNFFIGAPMHEVLLYTSI